LPGRKEIEAAARNLYGLLTARQPMRGETQQSYRARVARADAQYDSQAAALRRMLLGPVAALLGTKRLLIIADGALQYVPFAALPLPMVGGAQKNRPPNPGPRPLIADHEIVSLPSASVLAVMRHETAGRAPAAKSIAVLADPVFDKDDDRVQKKSTPSVAAAQSDSTTTISKRALRDAGLLGDGIAVPRLPLTRQEAEAIAALAPADATLKALGFKASLTTARSPELSHYRVVHFATHALVNASHPHLSGLLLSLVDEQGQPQDGFLSLNEVYNLNLPADLVVLSACQTGMGKEMRGEGLIGLTRGFMYAGAPRVVASLWKVDDVATSELMKQFYKGMLKEGLRPAAALRTAQIEMSKQKLWASPYYWAGFVLQGEWK
jgi:CHAT domain-containing protein